MITLSFFIFVCTAEVTSKNHFSNAAVFINVFILEKITRLIIMTLDAVQMMSLQPQTNISINGRNQNLKPTRIERLIQKLCHCLVKKMGGKSGKTLNQSNRCYYPSICGAILFRNSFTQGEGGIWRKNLSKNDDRRLLSLYKDERDEQYDDRLVADKIQLNRLWLAGHLIHMSEDDPARKVYKRSVNGRKTDLPDPT